MVLKYKFAPPHYYRNDQENEKFKQGVQNFEPLIHYVVEQEAVIQGIKMLRGVKPVFITRQEIVVLPRVEPIVTKGVLVVIRVKSSEPTFNQQNGSIFRKVPRDWSKGIHNVNSVPRPNSPRCTYCH